MKPTRALLALEDGSLFRGESIGADGQSAGEVVFNTAMSGYQEILTDPSYCRQIVTLTSPQIGNVGVTPEDEEAATIHAAGLVVRALPRRTSNWRSKGTLNEYLREREIVAIAGIDTRRLTRLLRQRGALGGCLVAGATIDEQVAIQRAKDFPGLKGMDLAQLVTTSSRYEWREGTWDLDPWKSRSERSRAELVHHVVAYDFGIKRNILRMLCDRGCKVTVVPAQTTATEALALAPDGIFLSNGPGDPEPCEYAIAATRALLETELPLFGICLGHQLLGLAAGARTLKMKFGHHGANHPVQDLKTKAVYITSQNHGFAVDEASLPEGWNASHRSLFDGTLQGIESADGRAFGFQGHPEASPGPHDVGALFDRFVGLMEQRN